MTMNPVAIAVFLALFAFVTLLGFGAARWRSMSETVVLARAICSGSP